MLEMKLPRRAAAGDGGQKTAEDEQGGGGVGGDSRLDKEAVFEWFGLRLSPARRLEFMCGLLHMCQPLELRFLGACLEDLARKDFHVLRDSESRANNPSDLGLLADVSDPVVRSKLLVSLSLLGSGNRECAGVLFRILSHAEPNPPGAGDEPDLDQMALLFTMASLHPAFPFHQRETLRAQLERVKKAAEEDGERRRRQQQQRVSTRNKVPKRGYLSPSTETRISDRAQSPLANQSQARTIQREAVYIEKIMLKGISRNRGDREYSFVVKWSDASSSSVTKTHQDLEDFLFKLPKEQAMEPFEKSILRLLSHGDRQECRDLEHILREKFQSAPLAFRQRGLICSFFQRDTSGSSFSHCKCALCGHHSRPGGLTLFFFSTAGSHPKYLTSLLSPLSLHSTKNVQGDSWRLPQVEYNGVADKRRKAPMTKLNPEPCEAAAQQHTAQEQWNSLPVSRTRAWPPGGGREKSKKGEDRVAVVPNGVMKTALLPLVKQAAGKGRGRDVCGETSSEGYSSPSSPQHDGHESLESEDDKDRDTDSTSDDLGKGAAETLSRKAIGGTAVATVRPMIPAAQREGPSHLESPRNAAEFSQLAFVQPMTYMMQNGAGKLSSDCEKPHLEPTLLTTKAAHLSGPPPANPVLQPLVQRFRTAPPPPNSESTVHQPPMGAISVIPPSSAYMSPLQPAYLGSDSTEPHIKCPPLPTSLPLPYSLPGTSAVVPPPGAAAMSTAGQAQSVPPPVVPTHTPGPAPTPSPALTHSTAQSDTTSYINSTTSGSSAGGPSQQQQGGPPQQGGCGACGCRGSCGSIHTPSYCYPPQVARQVFSIQPFIHLPSLCGGSYLSQAAQGSGATQLPFFPASPSPYAGAPLLHTPSDHMLGAQTGYSLQQMPAFGRFYPPLFPSMGVLPGSGGTAAMKKSSSASCYNCGVSGHYAHECKQPSADTTQQGGFRLKFVTSQSSGGPDKAD
ncbi:zinc finger CCHC domain-containing protein 2-like [Arapaima gigas]